MRRSIVAVAVTLFGVAAIGTITPARATQPDPDGQHKVWVCHATAGEGELKNGYNLIYVDEASTQPNGSYHGENDHYGHAHTSPKNNSKYGLLYDYLGVDPNDLPGKCGRPEMPTKDPVETLIGSEVDCDEGIVTETYEVTEYTYTWDGKGWVESETTTRVERSRDLTEEEAAACSTGERPPMPSKDPIEKLIGSETNCETSTVAETFRVTEYTYTWDGEVWVESETTTDVVRSRNMTQAEAATCPTQESQGPVPPAPPTVVNTPAVVTPAEVTPVAATPVPEVSQAPVVEAPSVAAAPAALPNTGSETWTIFLIGLATLLAGAGLVVLSHRSA
jgi:LPXTG-motif cell wall-anchored protein